MTHIDFQALFSPETMETLFSKEKTNQFFDALFGDAEEGAYEISLLYKGRTDDALIFEFHLNQRPGRCLACNLTYGLPQVFSRHPVINVNGIVDEINMMLNGDAKCENWQIGATREISNALHVIPLKIGISAN